MHNQHKEIFHDARRFIAEPRTKTTLERYQREWKSAVESGLRPLEYLDSVEATKPRQCALLRSALVWGLWHGIYRDLVNAVGKFRQGFLKLAVPLLNVASWKREVIERIRSRDYPQGAFRRKGKSKRGCLKGLPEDWRELAAEKTIPAAVPAVLVSFMSGCRPAELAKGIKVEIVDPGHLAITIRGAKTTKTKGQPWRRLFIATEGSSMATHLWKLTERKGGTLLVRRQPRALHKNMAQAAKAAGLPPISAYMARHFLASQLKNFWGQNAKKEIAMVLGHLSTKTQRAYGTSQQGRRGGIAIVGIEAAREVKDPGRSTHLKPTATPDEPEAPRLQSTMDLPAPTPFTFEI